MAKGQENVDKLIEICRDMGTKFGSLSFDGNLDAGTHNDPTNPLDTHFQRSWNVSVDNPIANMKRVDVTVTYPTSDGDRTVILSTFVTSKR